MAEPLDHHGGTVQRGLAHVPRSSFDEGRFGRLFRTLPPFAPGDDSLKALAASMAPVAATGEADDPAGDNPDIPSGYTYLGQFVDHDITFDTTSATGSQLTAENLQPLPLARIRRDTQKIARKK